MEILVVAGTRPEIIKCAPIYLAASNYSSIKVFLCNTGQHKKMTDQALDVFNIQPEFNLGIMESNQDLNTIIKRVSERLPNVINELKPDAIMIQGDTTTAMMTAIISFNLKKKLIHLESGLRSGNLYEPFPEEANRKLISVLTSIHLCPTETNRNNLISEGYKENIYVVGNSVIDALNIIKNKLNLNLSKELSKVTEEKKYVLVTSHRRENHGQGIINLCSALKVLADKYKNIVFIFPVHYNPNIRDVVHKDLNSIPNIKLIEPVHYIDILSLINNSMFCLTDSGGIQEEAPSFGKYCLILRNYTERIEAIENDFSELIGTDTNTIIERVSNIINSKKYLNRINFNPFGDGNTASRILKILENVI